MPGSEQIDVSRVRKQRLEDGVAHVVVEEPLEMRLDGASVAVTMRTPGHDVELVAGFMVSEGIVSDAGALVAIAHCDENQNVVDVRTAPGARLRIPAPRNFFASSSCGVCGKASIEEVRQLVPEVRGDSVRVAAAVLAQMPDLLREQQALFDETGALHAAGLFTRQGELLCVREDVGRHNAVDKVIGWAALSERLPLAGHVLLVSGRTGFEIAQKALMACIPVLAGISGPSSLAVELARESGMTLIAFLRGPEMTVCAGAERIEA